VTVKLLCVVLNYKTADMTIGAVRAALRELEPFPDARIDVVDNDSGDGSFDKLSAEFAGHPRVTVLETGHNGGFGYGNNYALRRALAAADPPEYLYILNSDAFPDRGAIRELVEYLDAHPEVGIAGSYIHGERGDPHVTAFRFFSLASELEGTMKLGVITKVLGHHAVPIGIPERTGEVDWLAGASMMMRRTMLEEVGLFDETFFLYFEETDLCRRAKLAGWSTVYVKESSVMHIGSVTTGMQDQSRRMPRYWFDSRRHYYLKNHGAPYLLAADVIHATASALNRVRDKIQRRPESRPHFVRDFLKYNFVDPVVKRVRPTE
jgi:N-acetylglucosaminyl-diphospho-decaprenol L-rhamnosyltransferase